jgi:D-tyrosyl-tRNA(Tyr) deacylase
VIAVVQRCDGARVDVAGSPTGGFSGPGLTILVGVSRQDTEAQADRLASKVWHLRLFEADRYSAFGCVPPGATGELSCADLGLPVLVISQFTLYGRTDKGRRPTWEDAAPRQQAEPLVDAVVASLRELGAVVTTGRFGADMRVSLVNDGPVTLIVTV